MRMLLALLLSLPLLAGGGGTVTFKQTSFLSEVAATDQEKAKGLMYRQSLPKDRCMFFVYSADSDHGIWMKNCLIALDVAWVDAEGRVVETVERVPPCSPMRGDDCPSYGGSVPSRHFIEFAAGTFKRLGLKKGDRLGWELTLDDGRVVRGGVPAAKAKKK
ncbi:MAG: DUF192 domain-containing protein [Holophagaceae bacterium]|jgi:hypothetical protein|nr:DUF192 domain-containing protein [Holophagaceae bacterium]